MNPRRTLVFITTTAVLALLLAGCGGKQQSQASNSAGSGSGSNAVMTAALQDGTYLATYKYTDAHGWQEFLQITVSGGKISKATFNAIGPDDTLKTNNESYNTQMKKIAGTNPQEYTKALDQELVSKQSTPVDAVTGATESSHSFNTLADKLIAAAKSGDTTPVVLPQNATYTAELAADTHGWIPHLEITFENGSISKVYYDGVQKENGKITARKSQDQSFQKSYSDATKNDVNKVFQTLESQLQQTGDPSKVDAVSGATTFSTDFKTLATTILEKQRVSVPPAKITSTIGS